MTAFVDFNKKNRDLAEPQASALATFVDACRRPAPMKATGTVVGSGAASRW